MSDYAYRPVGVEQAEIDAAAGLFRIVWPEAAQFTPAYVRWLYAENPSGPVIGMNAWAGNVLAGHYVIIPIRALYHGRPVPAALSLNTAVHPDHQGKGLFTKLAAQTYELARSRGCHHVIGVANANSTPGFLKKLEFELIAPLDVKVMWGSPAAEADPPGGAVAWRRFWEPADLAWRVRNPAAHYVQCTHRGTRQILAPTGRHGILSVLKLDPVAGAARLSLPAAPLGRFRLWMGLSRRTRFAALSSMRLPDRFRASPLNLIIRHLEAAREPIRADAVEFETIDFDAY